MVVVGLRVSWVVIVVVIVIAPWVGEVGVVAIESVGHWGGSRSPGVAVVRGSLGVGSVCPSDLAIGGGWVFAAVESPLCCACGLCGSCVLLGAASVGLGLVGWSARPSVGKEASSWLAWVRAWVSVPSLG